jgi:glycosyltransferase involved in cell wall biosynthesis
MKEWPHVWVVLDGCTDGSESEVHTLQKDGLKVVTLPKNLGKGGAVLHAMEQARESGFTQALVMDADGQHPTSWIRPFFKLAEKYPGSMILGEPVFGDDAPTERVHGRRVGNFFANVETLWGGVNDSLFGFRVYPIQESLRVMSRTRHGRRFDFDTELAVRLFWEGIRPISRKVPVYYPPRKDGGVSHFTYVRDNWLLIQTHIRLCFLLFPRIVKVWNLRKQWKTSSESL